MNTSPILVPPSNELQAQQPQVRPEPAAQVPTLGSSSSGKSQQTQARLSETDSPQDAVEVQWDSVDRVMVYQFVNQQGSLILQVPSEQMLSLAQQVSQELAQEAAPKVPAGIEGGKTNGH